MNGPISSIHLTNPKESKTEGPMVGLWYPVIPLVFTTHLQTDRELRF